MRRMNTQRMQDPRKQTSTLLDPCTETGTMRSGNRFNIVSVFAGTLLAASLLSFGACKGDGHEASTDPLSKILYPPMPKSKESAEPGFAQTMPAPSVRHLPVQSTQPIHPGAPMQARMMPGQSVPGYANGYANTYPNGAVATQNMPQNVHPAMAPMPTSPYPAHPSGNIAIHPHSLAQRMPTSPQSSMPASPTMPSGMQQAGPNHFASPAEALYNASVPMPVLPPQHAIQHHAVQTQPILATAGQAYHANPTYPMQEMNQTNPSPAPQYAVPSNGPLPYAPSQYVPNRAPQYAAPQGTGQGIQQAPANHNHGVTIPQGTGGQTQQPLQIPQQYIPQSPQRVLFPNGQQSQEEILPPLPPFQQPINDPIRGRFSETTNRGSFYRQVVYSVPSDEKANENPNGDEKKNVPTD